MLVITDEAIRQNLAGLTTAWKSPETFFLIPCNIGVSGDWVCQHINTLPDKYRRGHFVLLTSGTTGIPKLVIARRDRAEAMAEMLHKIQLSEEAKQTIVTLPLSYCYALINQWVWSRVTGRVLKVTDGLKDPTALKTVLNNNADAMLCLVGSQIAILFRYFRDIQFPTVCRLHFAGSSFPWHALDRIRHMFPNAEIFNNYGCAEAMPRLAVLHIDSQQTNERIINGQIGRPLPGIDFKLGLDGCLSFRSPYAVVAMADHTGVTAINSDQWIDTGDLAEVNNDGEWSLLGRSGNVFKRYGEKVSLSQLTSTFESVCGGQIGLFLETDPSGETGYVLVLSPMPNESELRALLLALRSNYYRAHWPLRIEATDTLQLSINGKLQSAALAKMTDRKILWRQRL